MENLKVFLADDHAILREGLRMILLQSNQCDIIGESGNGKEALEEIDRLKPDLVIMDISMPGMTGIEISRHLRKYHPEMKIIILSRHDNEQYLEQALKIGVHAYVLKDEAGVDLIRAIDAVRKGQTYLSPRLTSRLVSGLKGSGKNETDESGNRQFVQLTNREREVLKLVAEGHSNEEIGKLLRIVPQTVKIHRQNIMKKLDVHKVTELVKYAIKAGIIET